MKILLDESVPVQVRNALTKHEVMTIDGLGWKGRENGDLIIAAEQMGFEILIIADKNLRYQQNLTNRRLAIVELWTNHRPTLEQNFSHIASAVATVTTGSYVIIPAP